MAGTTCMGWTYGTYMGTQLHVPVPQMRPDCLLFDVCPSVKKTRFYFGKVEHEICLKTTDIVSRGLCHNHHNHRLEHKRPISRPNPISLSQPFTKSRPGYGAPTSSGTATEPSSGELDEQRILAVDASVDAGSVAGEETALEADETSNSLTERPVSEHTHSWRIRDATAADLGAIAELQASTFFEASAITAFNGFFFHLFKAELLDNLIQKAKYSPPKRYTILVAVPPEEPGDDEEGGGGEAAPEGRESAARENEGDVKGGDICGAVDLTAMVDADVLRNLKGAEEYLYISGMAVAGHFRRNKVASSLLKAAEVRALEWQFQYVALHVYEDNIPARRLYQKAGFMAIDMSALWPTTLFGRRRRVLMAKRTNEFLKQHGCWREGA
eukprot:jgi/Mesen1/8967/ME000056S08372